MNRKLCLFNNCEIIVIQNPVSLHLISILKTKDPSKRESYYGISLLVDGNETEERTFSPNGFTDEDEGDFVNFEPYRDNVRSFELKFDEMNVVVNEIYIFYVLP